MTDDGWTSRIVPELLALRDRRADAVPGVEPIGLDGIVGVTGMRDFVYLTEPIDSGHLVDVCRQLDPHSFVLVRDDEVTDVAHTLGTVGWTPRRELRLMIRPGGHVPPIASDLRIEGVTPANVADAERVHTDAFGLQVGLSSGWIDKSDAGLLLARDQDGSPAAISGWVRAAAGAKLAAVATRTDLRGHGLGTAMTAAAVCGALAHGAGFTFLEATQDGCAVYTRLGFLDVAQWNVFHRSPAPD